MWKEHRYLITYPLIMSGMAIMAWKRGTVSVFDKWYLIIAGTVGLYCWVSELVELLRERKKEKEEP